MMENKIGEKAFAEGVAEKIKQYLPPKYENVECKVLQQRKNNSVIQTGIHFVRPDQKMNPVLYVGYYYQDMRQGRPMDEIMREIAEDVQCILEEKNYPDDLDVGDYDKVKDYLSVKVINTRSNRQMLTELPHREIEDLSLTYLLKIPLEETGGIGNIQITNTLFKQWNISEEELYQNAVENAQKKEAPVLQSILSLVEEVESGKDESENILEKNNIPENLMLEPMFILSNKEKSFGASVMVYPEVMDKVSQLYPEGFYIIPSSIHELLIAPKDIERNAKELGELVREINGEMIEKKDILSDRVYEYDKEQGKIRQIPESIEKEKVMER